jgi:hypothetical protein
MALGTSGGRIAAAVFAFPAVVVRVYRWLGGRGAVARRLGDHRDWMLRSYAVISTAITLRLMLPAAGLLGLPFLPAYQAIAWLSWSTNLVLFEAWIRRARRNQISPASGLEGSAYLRVPIRPAR